MFHKSVLAPLLSCVLIAAMLTGPLERVALADGTVSSGTAHQSFYVWTVTDCCNVRYNVWVSTWNAIDYVTSYVYADQWLLNQRRFSGTIENENTYFDFWTESVRYQVFEPWGSAKYDWSQYQFAQQTVFCPDYDHCYYYTRDVYQEYITKGGAWGNTATWVTGGPDSGNLQGPQDNRTATLP